MAIKIDRATKPVSSTQLASELATADVRTAFSHNNNTPQTIEYSKRAKHRQTSAFQGANHERMTVTQGNALSTSWRQWYRHLTWRHRKQAPDCFIPFVWRPSNKWIRDACQKLLLTEKSSVDVLDFNKLGRALNRDLMNWLAHVTGIACHNQNIASHLLNPQNFHTFSHYSPHTWPFLPVNLCLLTFWLLFGRPSSNQWNLRISRLFFRAARYIQRQHARWHVIFYDYEASPRSQVAHNFRLGEQ